MKLSMDEVYRICTGRTFEKSDIGKLQETIEQYKAELDHYKQEARKIPDICQGMAVNYLTRKCHPSDVCPPICPKYRKEAEK